MANISKVYLLNTPLEDDMKNTLYFANASAQQSYMQNNILKSYTNVSYQRDTSIFRCPAHIDTIRNCNYIMFQNTAYSNKWFYGFIKKMTYIDDGRTDIEFAIDPLQTFMFDITVKPSFVEREHTNDDTVGSNVLPENVELGDYVSTDGVSKWLWDKDSTYFAIAVSKKANGLEGVVYQPAGSKLPDGLYYFGVKNVDSIKTIAKAYDKSKAADAIYAVFVVPSYCFSESGFGNVSFDVGSGSLVSVPVNPAPNMSFTSDQNISVPSGMAGGYSPRNQKLKTFPYRYMQASNNSGEVTTYHYEDFTSSTMTFQLAYSLCTGGSARVYPQDYKGRANNWDEGINYGKLPVGSWQTDPYVNWLTQNGVNMAVDTALDLATIAGGVASGTGAGVVSGLSGIANTLTQVYEHKLEPPMTKGNICNGDVNYTNSMTCIHFNMMSIKPQYARIVDDFFDMFGYATHRVKTPNTAHRQNWWYTKTIDCNITGNVPNDYLNEIKQAYNSGITFWRNPSNFLNYSVSNGIV